MTVSINLPSPPIYNKNTPTTNQHSHEKGYRSSPSNHISVPEEISYAKLPYPVPFKTTNPHQAQTTSHSVSLDSQLPVNVGGQAAFDFISSYDVPASGLAGNPLNAAAFAGSAPSGGHSFNADNVPKGTPSSAVETLREILNKNIPYTDPLLINQGPAIDVEYSDQGLGQYPQHDTNQHSAYGAPPLSTSSSSSSSASSSYSESFPNGFGDFQLTNDNNVPNTHGHHEQEQAPHEQHHTNHNHYQAGADSNPVQQYEIPPDPKSYVPAFKPLTKAPLPYYGRYGAAPGSYALPPVQAVYQTHSVHTAYGPPAKFYRPAGTNNNNIHGGGRFGHGNGLGPVAAPFKGNMYLPPQNPHKTYGPPGPINRRSHLGINSNNRKFLKMHGKRSNGLVVRTSGNVNAPRNSGGVGGPRPVNLPVVPVAPINSQPIVVADQQRPEHEYQSQRLQDSLGVDIEVQKSIGYELEENGKPKEAAPEATSKSSTNRRNSESGDSDLVDQVSPSSSNVAATGPIYSRPYSRRRQTPKMYTFHRYWDARTEIVNPLVRNCRN